MKTIRKTIFAVMFAVVMSMPSFAAGRLSVQIGNFTSWKETPHGVLISAGNAKLSLTVYGPEVVRVRATQNEFSTTPSYAVITEPSGKFTSVKDEKDKLVLSTGELKVEVNKNPVLVRFYNKDGKLLNEDDPGLGISWLGTGTTCYKKLQPDERFIGLGEKTGNLDRRGSAYVDWNTDNPAYATNGDPLYTSLPFYIGLHNQLAYGIFFDNTYKATFNFGASNNRFSSFGAVDGEMNYYFFGGYSVADLLKEYTDLTGRIKMPPIWGLGFQQSRWSYFPDTEVLNLARTFREKKIPADVIYLDIHYMDAYKVFTWNKERFPKPSAMIDSLKDMGFHIVTIVDPGVKKEKGYWAYDSGLKNDCFVKYPDGTNWSADVWPGTCNFPDFTNPKVRTWWGNLYKGLVADGVTGFWNDMNEPASWGNMVPNLVEFDMEGHKGTMEEAHNVYGMQMARSTYQGATKLMDGKRPLVLTRAAYAGIQRYSAIWTGDNVASDEHMLLASRLINSMGLAGVPYVGADIGGFMGGTTNRKLFARWISIAAYTPFFRSHSEYNSRAHEPWTFGEDVEAISRKYIDERYQLLPYIYSAFYQAHETGMPIARSLAINYTFDKNIYNPDFQDEYLFGPSILVAPVSSEQNFGRVYLPKGVWYRKSTGKKYDGGQSVIVDAPLSDLPVFVKAGAIIPMQSTVQNTAQEGDGILRLHIYSGSEPNKYLYYEDDGTTYQYQDGHFLKREFAFDPMAKKITIGKAEGNYTSKFNKIEIVLHGFDAMNSVEVGRKAVSLQKGEGNTQTLTLDANNGETVLSW